MRADGQPSPIAVSSSHRQSMDNVLISAHPVFGWARIGEEILKHISALVAI